MQTLIINPSNVATIVMLTRLIEVSQWITHKFKDVRNDTEVG